MKRSTLLLVSATLFGGGCIAPAVAQPPPAAVHDQWVTLGTQGGPVPTATRSQPANALVRPDGGVILVDAGDGAVEQLTRAGYQLRQVDTVFLSHLHFDHTAGMLGVLGLLFQGRAPQTVAIYGPPGTQAFVSGLLASMQPFAEGGFGIVGEHFAAPSSLVRVTELTDGSAIEVHGVRVQAVQNTHYSFPPGSDLDRRFKSLAYRFDLDDRSIVFTGDTGPSEAVTRLAQGADLLVAEMIDLPGTIALIERQRPDLKGKILDELIEHQRTQHLQPGALGLMAEKAGVKAIVVTHLVPGGLFPHDLTASDKARYRTEIAKAYSGPVTFARDLDKF